MRHLEKRIVLLESRLDATTGATTALPDALLQLRTVLHEALMAPTHLTSSEGWIFAGHRMVPSFEGRVCALHDRISAGTVTDEDRVVLCCLPDESLQSIGMTAKLYVETLSTIFRSY